MNAEEFCKYCDLGPSGDDSCVDQELYAGFENCGRSQIDCWKFLTTAYGFGPKYCNENAEFPRTPEGVRDAKEFARRIQEQDTEK